MVTKLAKRTKLTKLLNKIILLGFLAWVSPSTLIAEDATVATEAETIRRQNPFQRTFPKEYAAKSECANTPLGHFSLDVLRFVGTVKLASHLWGLISLPDATVVSVQKGSYLGKNCGKIVHIAMKKLLIEEKVFMAGKWEERLTSVDLKARI